MDLLHLVTPRADQLLSHVRGAQDGDARHTHQARVAARRLAEVLALTGDAGKRLDRDVRSLRRALGATRELDVSRMIFDQAALSHRWSKDAEARVRKFLARERERRHKKVAGTLEAVSVSRLRRRIRAVGEYAHGVAGPRVGTRVRKRVAEREKELLQAIKRAGATYNIDKLHDVRLAVKKLRYTLEVAQDAIGRRWTKRIAALKLQQGRLGDLHDLQVLVGHIRVLESELVGHRGPVAEALAVIRRDLDAESRRLHGQWLKQTKTKGM
jgi:CHAD domain-containing protein